MKVKGVITVFLALSFVCISSLILALVESARTAGLRYYEETAANAAIDSLFSNYHIGLWERYRLVLLDAPDEEEIKEKYLEYMTPYLTAGNWLTMTETDAEIEKCDVITSGGGEWLEQEILDYMKYGLIEDIVRNRFDPEELKDELKQAESMQKVTDAYAQQSKNAIGLEKTIKKLNDSTAAQRTYRSAALDALRSGNNSAFQSQSRKLESEIKKFESLRADYIRQADMLADELAGVSASEGYAELTGENQGYVDNVRSGYDDYIESSGERRKAIDEAGRFGPYNLAVIDDAQDMASMVNITWQDEPAAYDEEGNLISPGVSYEVERRAEWNRIYGYFLNTEVPQLNLQCGVADESKESLIENVGKILSGDLLTLVIPEGRKVSGKAMDMSELPSVYHEDLNRVTDDRSVTDSLIIGEYVAAFFNNFTDFSDNKDTENMYSDADDDIGDSETKEKDESKCSVNYETEYIIGGMNSDKGNLSKAVGEIFLVREGLNYLHIISDGNKMREVNELATAIVGSTGLPLLEPLIACLIIGAWAGAESLIDCRELLDNKKVPIIKSTNDWKLDVTSVLTLGQKGNITSDKKSYKGVDYETYLKFLLLTMDNIKRNYRMMDIIQNNLRLGDSSFFMSDCIYGLKMKVICKAKHIFALGSEVDIVCDAEKAY